MDIVYKNMKTCLDVLEIIINSRIKELISKETIKNKLLNECTQLNANTDIYYIYITNDLLIVFNFTNIYVINKILNNVSNITVIIFFKNEIYHNKIITYSNKNSKLNKNISDIYGYNNNDITIFSISNILYNPLTYKNNKDLNYYILKKK